MTERTDTITEQQAAAEEAAAAAGPATSPVDSAVGEASFADAAAPPASPTPVPEAEPAAPLGPEDELAAAQTQAGEYLALAQRTAADFDNYRKRSARDAALAGERGMARLAKELLPAVDNLEHALRAAAEHGEAGSEVVKGFGLVRDELINALRRVGIEPFSPAGEVFDPVHHEAMAQIPAPGATSGTVVEVYQSGYRMNETVLRPARVVVAA